MAEAGVVGRSRGLAEAEPDLSPRGEPESPGEHEDEPGLFSSSRSLSLATVGEVASFRSSSLSASEISFSVGDLEVEDDEMMYRLMQSEYEEIPSFRWIASSLRWWKTKRSSRRTHPSKRSDASGTSRHEKPEPAPEGEVESGGEPIDGLVRIGGHLTYTVWDLLRGRRVASKNLALGARVISREEFEDKVNALGKIRHPNLVPLTAYGSQDEKLLVFDHMPMRSLWAALRDRSRLKYLHRPTKMNIAIGIASGMYDLHTQENMVHGNLTSRNVLLDDLTNANISDYVIYNISKAATHPARVKAEAPLRYHAPEFSNLQMANTETDVYSHGMIILEVLMAEDPDDVIEGLDLPHWFALTKHE